MTEELRTQLIKSIDSLKDDFRLLYPLRHNHNLYIPMTKIIRRIRILKNVLDLYPLKKCENCGHPIED